MEWLHELSYFAGGLVLANAIPHFVSGTMGRPFQSPFAKPHGEGLSSSTINAVWGFFNLVIAYLPGRRFRPARDRRRRRTRSRHAARSAVLGLGFRPLQWRQRARAGLKAAPCTTHSAP
jgi:hypothetical protein